VEEFFADRRPSDLLLVHFPATGSKMRTASCTSRRPTLCWAGWARPQWRPSSSAGG
jgi:hypothetical protein